MNELAQHDQGCSRLAPRGEHPDLGVCTAAFPQPRAARNLAFRYPRFGVSALWRRCSEGFAASAPPSFWILSETEIAPGRRRWWTACLTPLSAFRSRGVRKHRRKSGGPATGTLGALNSFRRKQSQILLQKKRAIGGWSTLDGSGEPPTEGESTIDVLATFSVGAPGAANVPYSFLVRRSTPGQPGFPPGHFVFLTGVIATCGACSDPRAFCKFFSVTSNGLRAACGLDRR